MKISDLLTNLSSNIAVITLLTTLIAGVVKFGQWINIKKTEEKKIRFRTYHKLIKDLVEPDKVSGSVWLDRQIAIIYELRNFPEYFKVTKRILTGLKTTWTNTSHRRIIDEINLTIGYINGNRIQRIFNKD